MNSNYVEAFKTRNEMEEKGIIEKTGGQKEDQNHGKHTLLYFKG